MHYTTDDFDLDAYLRRIHYTGNLDPTLDTLTGLLLAHTGSIPFENLDVVLGRPIQLNLANLQEKIFTRKRGGYCFEHGTIFAAALASLGFNIDRHMARSTLFLPRTEAPRTHMFLTVSLPEGRFVADPGFGGLAPRFPLPIPNRDVPVQNFGTSKHRMVFENELYVMQAQTQEKTIDAWVSTLEPQIDIDFVVANHYTSTHPNSSFVNRIMLRAFSGDAIVSVLNRDAKIQRGGSIETFQLADRSALRSLVAEHLGVDVPEIDDIHVPAIQEWV